MKALQLMNKAKEGQIIPEALPPSLLPFKVRHSSISNSSAVIINSNNLFKDGINPSIANEIKVIG
jgi:hypothetical protein